MNKNLLFTFLLWGAFHFTANAQVPNPGFENLLSNGSPANWGNVYIFSAWIDSTGTLQSDSIVFDNNWFYKSTTDTHSGQYAMELSNAFNYSQNTAIAGAIGVDEDSLFTAWGIQELIPVYGSPIDFGFYYKFIPVNNDTGYASITLIDSSGNTVGAAEVFLTSLTTTYNYSNTFISVIPGGVPAFMSIQFSTSVPGGQTSFGTRLLIDDVEVNTTLSGSSELINVLDFHIYPNPASNLLNIQSNHQVDAVRMYSVDGKLIKEFLNKLSAFDISALPNGIFILEIQSGSTTGRKVFLKE
jgi:hypothetical protein